MSGKKGLEQTKERKSEEVDARTKLILDNEESQNPPSKGKSKHPYIADSPYKDASEIKSKTFSIAVTENASRNLKLIALARGKRVNGLINDMIADYIKKHQSEIEQGLQIEAERNQNG